MAFSFVTIKLKLAPPDTLNKLLIITSLNLYHTSPRSVIVQPKVLMINARAVAAAPVL